MTNECDKHPDNFMSLNPKEFAKVFGGTSYFFQKDCYEEIAKEYERQADGDRKIRKRVKLAGGLEMLAQSLREGVANASNYVCGICKHYMKKK